MSSLSAPDAWWERGASVSLRAVTWGDSQPVRYAVTVNVLSHSYTILRRYRAFDALNRSLRELAQQHAVAWDPVARLPPKAVLRSRSSAFLESRRTALENYLNDVLAAVSPCVQHAELRRELAAFLELRLLPSGERVMGEAPALDSAALVREKRVAWRGGATVVDSGRVYFTHLDAARRVVRRTLLSTDASFFERAQWMHIPYTPPQRDIEAARSCVSRSPPLVADVPLTSGPALLSLADVTAHIHKLKQLFPEGYDGMWRLNGRTANDIPALNTLVR